MWTEIVFVGVQLIYQGSAPGVLKFFEESGFPCPEFTNPADHLLDVISHNDRHEVPNDEKLRSNFVASPVRTRTAAVFVCFKGFSELLFGCLKCIKKSIVGTSK